MRAVREPEGHCGSRQANLRDLRECQEEDMNIYRIMQTFQEQQAAIRELESKLELQPCDHPRFCDRVGEEVAPGQFVHTCAWCESLEAARQKERDACYRELCPWCRDGHADLLNSSSGFLHNYNGSYRPCLASPLRVAHLFASYIGETA